MPAVNLDKQTYEVPGSRKPGQTGTSNSFQVEPISFYVSRTGPIPNTLPHTKYKHPQRQSVRELGFLCGVCGEGGNPANVFFALSYCSSVTCAM